MTARPSDRLRCVVVATWYPTVEGPVDGIFVREPARARDAGAGAEARRGRRFRGLQDARGVAELIRAADLLVLPVASDVGGVLERPQAYDRAMIAGRARDASGPDLIGARWGAILRERVEAKR